MNASRNSGFWITILIFCIAAVPSLGASRSSAGMMHIEKTKNSPPMRPAPIAPTRVSWSSQPSMVNSS